MGHIAAYVRTSSVDQEGEGQIAALQTAILQRGEFVGPKENSDYWYIDKNQSSTKATRPEMERLKADAAAGKIAKIYTFELTRIGRSVTDLLQLFVHFEKTGTSLISLKEQIDMSTAAGKLQFHILASFAEFERERGRERSRAWVKFAKDNKVPVGRFRTPVTDAQYEKILTMRSNNVSYRDIAAAVGVPKSTVFRVATRERDKTREREPEKKGPQS